MTLSAIDLTVTYHPVNVFVELLEHRENEDPCKGADHGGRVLRAERHAGEDGDDQEVDVGRPLELVEEREERP